MNCTHAQKIMQEYLEGALGTLDTAGFEEHVRRCESCAREVEAMRGVFSLLGELEPEDVPAGFEDAVIARVKPFRRARTAHEASRLRWVGTGSQPLTRAIRYPLAAVVVLLAVYFPFIVLRGGIREATGSLVVMAGEAIVSINQTIQEFGVFYRLIEVLKVDLRIAQTVFSALTSLAWSTGETVLLPGLVLIAGIIIGVLVIKNAHRRRPHNAPYSF
jgi:predicted anti-sigma-YlaC factor YlaD